MGKLILHDTSKTREEIEDLRRAEFLKKTPTERFFALLHLNSVAVKLNGGKPLKYPQGKGIVIKKIKP